MTIEEMVLRIEKMGFKITVDYNPSSERVAYIKKRIELKKQNEK